MCGAEVVWEISVSSKFCYELKAALKNKVYWKKKKKMVPKPNNSNGDGEAWSDVQQFRR